MPGRAGPLDLISQKLWNTSVRFSMLESLSSATQSQFSTKQVQWRCPKSSPGEQHMKPSVEKVNFGENPWILARLPCKKLVVWELCNETFRLGMKYNDKIKQCFFKTFFLIFFSIFRCRNQKILKFQIWWFLLDFLLVFYWFSIEKSSKIIKIPEIHQICEDRSKKRCISELRWS